MACRVNTNTTATEQQYDISKLGKRNNVSLTLELTCNNITFANVINTTSGINLNLICGGVALIYASCNKVPIQAKETVF